jgi:predicted 3-demethylubiquinone-9 3-methyltransferase (glyoxalase superfamily)
MHKITPCLWYDKEAEEAANYYVSIFSARGEKSSIGKITRYGQEGQEVHGKPVGSVMTVEFELAGQKYIALNGGTTFKLTEAVSFVIDCATQDEVDYYWEKLTAGGDEKSQICGWLKDKYGLSWQVMPKALGEMLGDKDPQKAGQVMNAMLKMKKIDLKTLEDAYNSSY